MSAQSRPWDRRATIALAVVVVVALASLPWLVHGWFEAGDETNDAAIYVASARALLAGEGYSYLGEPFTVRPPGMSLWLAALFAWRGTDWHAVNLSVALSGVACVAFLFVHAQRRIGALLAALVAFAVWFSTPFQTLCNQAMSDVPGAALLFACLTVERWADARPSMKRDVVLGLCIGLSTYVRSVTILLVPAIAVARLLQAWSGARPMSLVAWGRFALVRVAPLLLAAFAAKIPWDVRCATNHPTPPVDQNFLYSYSTAMWHVDGGDPASPRRELSSIAARVPERARTVTALLGSRMTPTEERAGHVAAGLVLLALAAVTLWRRRESAELFAGAFLVVLLVYFGFRDRLALPLWLVVLPAAAEGLLVLARTRSGGPLAAALVAAPLVALPFLDFRPRSGWDRVEAQHLFYERYAAEVAAAVPADRRVASPIGWHLAVFLERPVWSLFFAMRRAGGPEGALAAIERHRIDAVALSPRVPADRGLAPWLAPRMETLSSTTDTLVLGTRR
jgi:MYXO-CTERM domain-containing protein